MVAVESPVVWVNSNSGVIHVAGEDDGCYLRSLCGIVLAVTDETRDRRCGRLLAARAWEFAEEFEDFADLEVEAQRLIDECGFPKAAYWQASWAWHSRKSGESRDSFLDRFTSSRNAMRPLAPDLVSPLARPCRFCRGHKA